MDGLLLKNYMIISFPEIFRFPDFSEFFVIFIKSLNLSCFLVYFANEVGL